MKNNKLHIIKKTGFKTPDNYFELFEAKLKEELVEKETIQNIESTGYSVPKDYFDIVEENILVKIINDNKPVAKLKSRNTFYYFSGIAASFILLFSLVFNTKNTISIDTIETVAIESYLYQEDYSNDDLASLFKSDEISYTDFIDVNMSEETLNEYLDTIDTEDFILD